jgi:hypothetical protein
MLRLLLPILLLGWAGETCAQFLRDCDGPAWITATLASYHLERPNGYEERNLGIGFEHACGELRGVGGVYRNSNRRTSLYAGVTWLPLAWRELRAGAFAGVFSGYSESLLPAGAFVGAWEGRRYGVNLLLFPPYDDFKGVLVLQLKARF